MNRIFLQGVILLLSCASCLKEEPMKKTYRNFIPVDISDGWTISDPETEHMDAGELDKIYREVYADDRTWMMKSLLVFRNGELIAESYLKDEADRTAMDAIWSCTKQIHALITGIAMEQGYIHDIHDSVGKYLPEYILMYPDKKGITIEHLLTMTSGIAFDNGTDNDILRQHKTDNSLNYVLGMNLSYPPGENFTYKDSDPHILSGILQGVQPAKHWVNLAKKFCLIRLELPIMNGWSILMVSPWGHREFLQLRVS